MAHVRSVKFKLCSSLSGLKRKYLPCLVIGHSLAMARNVEREVDSQFFDTSDLVRYVLRICCSRNQVLHHPRQPVAFGRAGVDARCSSADGAEAVNRFPRQLFDIVLLIESQQSW